MHMSARIKYALRRLKFSGNEQPKRDEILSQGTAERWWDVCVEEEWAARARVSHVAKCRTFRFASPKTPNCAEPPCESASIPHLLRNSRAGLFQAASLAHLTYVALNVSDLRRHSFHPTIKVDYLHFGAVA